MAETLERGEETILCTYTNTYTYDCFTVFFYGDHVYVGGKEYPVGQCCVDVMNLDDTIPDELDRRVRELIPAA